MPSRTLKYKANSRLADRARKKGLWRKLWAMVLEFHHKPSARTGATGTASSSAMWPTASSTSGASQREQRIENFTPGAGRPIAATSPKRVSSTASSTHDKGGASHDKVVY